MTGTEFLPDDGGLGDGEREEHGGNNFEVHHLEGEVEVVSPEADLMG